MKLHVISDVHLEFSKWPTKDDVNAIDADISILAGDIGVGLEGLQWALTFKRQVLYVMGNHEFYGQRPMNELWVKARQRVENTHVHILENNAVVINGVRFLGATLWTDFAALGEANQDACMRMARENITDYRVIYASHRGQAMTEYGYPGIRKGDLLTPQKTLAMHHESREFLERELDKSANGLWRKTVVVTHHAPSALSLEDKVAVTQLDAAYCSHLACLVEKADLWIHGHTHWAVDYRIGKGRVISNPRGYTGLDRVIDFAPSRIIDI